MLLRFERQAQVVTIEADGLTHIGDEADDEGQLRWHWDRLEACTERSRDPLVEYVRILLSRTRSGGPELLRRNRMPKSTLDPTARQLAFLARLTEAEQRLKNACSGLGRAAVSSEPVVGNWSVKDIVGHIIAWNATLRLAIQAILDDEPPGRAPRIDPANGFDKWNQAHVARMRHWTWQRMRVELDRDCREAEGLILRLGPSEFRRRGVTPWKLPKAGTILTPTGADTESVQTLIAYHWRHMHEHARQIERWRQRQAPRKLPG